MPATPPPMDAGGSQAASGTLGASRPQRRPPCAHEGVPRHPGRHTPVPRVGTHRSAYHPGLHDLEAGQGGDHLLRGAEHAGVTRATRAVIEIAAVVTDVEQSAAGSHRGTRRGEHALTLPPRELQIADQHQMVKGPAGPIAPHVGQHPSDARAMRPRQTPRLRQADRREIDGRHAPAARGEPDGVSSFAGSEIERAPGTQPSRRADEQGIGRRAPEELRAGVASVPILAIHGSLV